MKKILGHIGFLWSAIVMIFTGFWVGIAFVITLNIVRDRPRRHLYVTKINRIWGKTCLFFMGVPYRIHGKEKVQPGRNYVIACNHRSGMDVAATCAIMHIPYAFLAKIEVNKIPVIGYVCRTSQVYVDRKSPEARKASYRRMVDHVASGYSILLYVEGTRNKTKEPLQRFYDGAFRLAIETQTPLAVLTFKGTDDVMHTSRKYQFFPGNRVDVTWGEVIETKGMTIDDLEALKARARAVMLKSLA